MMVNMRVTSRSEPSPAPGPSRGDDLDTGVTGLLRYRRLAIRVLLVIFLLLPVVTLLRSPPLTGRDVFLILGTLAFAVLVDRIVLVQMPEPGRYARWQWALVPIVFALGATLFAVGHMAWITPLAVASAGVGRMTPDGRPTVLGLVGCTGIAVAISAATGLGYGNTIVAGAVVALGNLLAHSAERRNVLMYRLKETRAELARAAVAEERLRISRDLHDLLGHSLSLITLKAELAGRVIRTDPERAAREIAELETVARRSLTEVRQAVTSYRQPSLAAELVSSRRMLASAGTECQIRAPGAFSLPPAVDALLAWTVREGATNIVRHAAARHAEIVIELAGRTACACLSDDGVGPGKGSIPGMIGSPSPAAAAGAAAPAAWADATAKGAPAGAAAPGAGADATAKGAAAGAAAAGAAGGGQDGTGAGPGLAAPVAGTGLAAPVAGTGLAGLAERAARLGGALSAGAGERGGFWLRVSVPLADPAPANAVSEPGQERTPS